MHITQKRTFERKTYKLCWKNLEKVAHHPYLGMELADDLKCNQHIRNTSCKANRMLGLFRRNLYRCREKVKETAYTVLVRSKLEYCASVWDPSVQISIDALEMVQRRAARFVRGDYRRESGVVTELLSSLQQPSLVQRRAIANLLSNDGQLPNWRWCTRSCMGLLTSMQTTYLMTKPVKLAPAVASSHFNILL